MLHEYTKLNIVNIENRHIFTTEVNWKEDDKNTNECKILKLTFKDGKVEYIKKETLLSLLWLIGSSVEHQKMIPVEISKTRVYETIIGVKATKDIHKGEMINTAIKIQLPSVHDEVMGDMIKAKRRFVDRLNPFKDYAKGNIYKR